MRVLLKHGSDAEGWLFTKVSFDTSGVIKGWEVYLNKPPASYWEKYYGILPPTVYRIKSPRAGLTLHDGRILCFWQSIGGDKGGPAIEAVSPDSQHVPDVDMDSVFERIWRSEE